MTLEFIKGFKCKRCGHEWRPHNLNKVSKECPKCKNCYWNIERKIHENNV